MVDQYQTKFWLFKNSFELKFEFSIKSNDLNSNLCAKFELRLRFALISNFKQIWKNHFHYSFVPKFKFKFKFNFKFNFKLNFKLKFQVFSNFKFKFDFKFNFKFRFKLKVVILKETKEPPYTIHYTVLCFTKECQILQKRHLVYADYSVTYEFIFNLALFFGLIKQQRKLD